MTTPQGTANSPAAFTIIGPGPFISSFSPAAGNVGNPIQITGRFFTGVTNVQFNGTSVPGFPGPSSDTFISVNLPSGASSGLITLKAASGIGTSSTNFYVPPTVTSFSPPSGSAFSTVTVNGSSFIGATSVTFNGATVQNPTVNAQGTQLTTTVPPTATTGLIRVIAPAGSAQSAANFVVLPTITTFSPGNGPPGTLVTVNGYNFSGVTSVKSHGVSATSFTIVNSSQLTATVPAAATSGPISVTTPDGTVSSANSFYLPPGIRSFTPNQGVWPQTVTISGTNFTGASAVRFAGTAAFDYSVDSDTSISTIVPTPNATSGAISVVTPGGTATSAANFYWPPSVSSFSPGHGLPFDQIAIFGVNFLGASQVFFNGTLTTNFSVINNGSMQARVPSGALTGPITIVAPAGTTTSTNNFILDYSSDLYPLTTVSNTVTVGSNLVYSILIYNAGPNDALNVRVTNTLPASVTLTSAYVTQGSLTTNSNPIIGNLGTLNAFTTASILLTVVPHTVGQITNIFAVASDYPDPAPSNNVFTNITQVLSLPRLSITSSVPRQVTVSWPNDLGFYSLQSKAVPSANFSWLNVTNLRQTNATSIYVTDGASNAAKFYRLTK